MGEPVFYLLDSLHTLSGAGSQAEAWLGRIVRNYRDPEKAYSPENTHQIKLNLAKKDGAISSLYQRITRHDGTLVHVALTDMLGLSTSRTKTSEPSFESQQVERYYLTQIDEVKRRLLEDAAAKLKLEERISFAHPVYLVAGVLVADRVRYNEERSEVAKAEASLDPLPSDVALAAGLPPQANVRARVEREKATEHSRATTVVGRRVFAVEYVVLRKRLSKLGATKWRSMPRVEGTFGLEGGEEGVLRMEGVKDAEGSMGEREEFEILVDEEPILQFEEAEEMCFGLGLRE